MSSDEEWEEKYEYIFKGPVALVTPISQLIQHNPVYIILIMMLTAWLYGMASEMTLLDQRSDY